MASVSEIKQTPLFALHEKLGGKLVEFAGWQLPIQYPDGIMAEHRHCRSAAALFDVSHMGQLMLTGDDLAEKLEELVPADLINTPVGKARYTFLTNEHGGVIDDLIITRAEDHFYVVVNASRRDVDLTHLHSQLSGVDIAEINDHALLALQGPKAVDVLAELCPEAKDLIFMESTLAAIDGVQCRVSRLGYTGEDGFEIAVPNTHAVVLAEKLLAHADCKPAGLGARDTLRLEASLCLYGQELDESRSPIEAGLTWAIPKRRREEGGFLGEQKIIQQIRETAPWRLVGITPEGKVPARQGVKVFDLDDRLIGEITSGGFSPTLNKPIALAYVESELATPGTEVMLEIRKKKHTAKLCELPFVEHRYHR